jgi:hypothetical protein
MKKLLKALIILIALNQKAISVQRLENDPNTKLMQGNIYPQATRISEILTMLRPFFDIESTKKLKVSHLTLNLGSIKIMTNDGKLELPKNPSHPYFLLGLKHSVTTSEELDQCMRIISKETKKYEGFQALREILFSLKRPGDIKNSSIKEQITITDDQSKEIIKNPTRSIESIAGYLEINYSSLQIRPKKDQTGIKAITIYAKDDKPYLTINFNFPVVFYEEIKDFRSLKSVFNQVKKESEARELQINKEIIEKSLKERKIETHRTFEKKVNDILNTIHFRRFNITSSNRYKSEDSKISLADLEDIKSEGKQLVFKINGREVKRTLMPEWLDFEFFINPSLSLDQKIESLINQLDILDAKIKNHLI